MNERLTVRLLLLDRSDRLLLMKCDDPSVANPASPGSSVFWATLGGEIEAGEDVMSAARREGREETGQDLRLGPAVWYGEQVLLMRGRPTLFKETFVVAFPVTDKISDSGWTETERQLIQEMRWWTLEALWRTEETVYPAVMRDLLPAILAGDYPQPVLRIAL